MAGCVAAVCLCFQPHIDDTFMQSGAECALLLRQGPGVRLTGRANGERVLSLWLSALLPPARLPVCPLL